MINTASPQPASTVDLGLMILGSLAHHDQPLMIMVNHDQQLMIMTNDDHASWRIIMRKIKKRESYGYIKIIVRYVNC